MTLPEQSNSLPRIHCAACGRDVPVIRRGASIVRFRKHRDEFGNVCVGSRHHPSAVTRAAAEADAEAQRECWS